MKARKERKKSRLEILQDSPAYEPVRMLDDWTCRGYRKHDFREGEQDEHFAGDADCRGCGRGGES